MLQLQSILLPNKNICDIPELYYHNHDDRVDFDGYFNVFYIEKRKEYTAINQLELSISCKGYSEIILMHDHDEIGRENLDATQDKEYIVEFPYNKYESGLFWFRLITCKKMDIDRNGCLCYGYWGTESKKTQEINIGIDICTYRREPYVLRNLKQIKERLLDKTELDVSKHIRIYVIDNGKTLNQRLDIQELKDCISNQLNIYDNMNAGGAGGFTRGMIEVLDDKENYNLSHVLLMDDDAVIEPDTLVRLYGLLSTLKEEWKTVTVGGNMLREDYMYLLFCGGEYWENGAIHNPEMHLDLRNFDVLSDSYLMKTGHEYEWYSGWWCCCYSLETVTKDSLPLPLFIHHDDIEYGLRNQNYGVAFLNGIGVWHRGAELSFIGGNLYYDVRNNLIETVLHQNRHKRATAYKIIYKMMISSFIRLKEKDMELVYKGLRDFLKGPEWLYNQNPEKLNNKIRSMTYQMMSLEDLKLQLTDHEYLEFIRQLDQKKQEYGTDMIIKSRKRKTSASWLQLLTLNGWLLPVDNDLITVLTPTDSPFDGFRKRKIILYEWGSRKAIIVERKFKLFKQFIAYFFKTTILLILNFDRANTEYNNKLHEISNEESWKKYLSIDKYTSHNSDNCR